ncbi:MAG: nucleotidyltransferase family protein [Candidatus Woesearchaeota archaeon]
MKNYMMNSLEISKYILESVTAHKPIGLPSYISQDKFLNIADKNNLLLAVIDKFQKKSAFSSEFYSKYHYYKNFYMNSSSLIEEMIQNCNKNKLPLLTIKSFLPFPFADSNIDLVAIERRNILKYQSIIKQMNFKRKRNLADLREPDKKMYYKNSQNRLLPKLHLHKQISWNGVTYLNLDTIWARSQWRKDLNHGFEIPVPSPEDELLIIAAHSLFENKYITLCDLAHLICIFKNDLDWDYTLKAAEEYHWSQGFLEFTATAMELLKDMGFNLNVEAKLSTPIRLKPDDHFPILLPFSKTIKITANKLFRDFASRNIERLPRELLSYIVVEPFWMYYKGIKKKRSATIK